MKYIVIMIMLFATPASAALNEIEQKLQSSPSMTARCDAKITYLQGQVYKYRNLITAKRNVVVNKLKLELFKSELQNWKGYCADPDNSVSRGR